jgi:hypothetical protein
MTHQLTIRRRTPRAYTLIEALLMVVILSIISIPVGNALVAAARNTEGNENTLAIDSALASQMEILRATCKAMALGSQTTSITIGNNTYTMTLDVEKTDADGTGTLQPNFLSLSITIAGRNLSTKVSTL